MAAFTRENFCQLLAIAIGYPVASATLPGGTIQQPVPQWLSDWLGGWSAHEIAVDQPYPSYNLFGCGQPWPGATVANNAGVKNYPSLGAGVAAMAQNLNSGLFTPLVSAIRAGDQGALTSSQGVTQSLHNWRAGPNSQDFSGYESQIGGFILLGAAHRGDTFTGPDGGGGGGTQPTTTAIQIQCAAFEADPTLYAACLLASGQAPIEDTFQSVESTVTGAGPMQALSNILTWLSDKANWLRIAKIAGGILLILTGLVLSIVVLSKDAASTPLGKAVLGTAEKAAMA